MIFNAEENKFRTGAIFCGGKSSRMGKDKAGVVLKNGKTLIEHVYGVLSEVCKEVILIGHGQGVPRSLRNLKRIDDNYPGIGPMGAMEALLSSGWSYEYLVLPCDLININQEMLKLLYSTEENCPVILKIKGRIEPLIGRYSIDILPLVRKHIYKKEHALHKLIASSNATVIDVPLKYERAVINANTPEDLLLV